MASNSGDLIQRLNLVHPPPPPQPSEAAQDLLAAPSYGDLAQLDLWTNVAFASDEPFVRADLNSDDGSDKDGKESSASELVKRKRDQLAKKSYLTMTATGQSSQPVQQQASALFPPATAPAVSYDLQSLLAVTGNQFSPDAMNLNQILYGNPFQPAAFAFPPTFQPVPAPAPAPPQQSNAIPPPAKKARSRKSSTVVQPVHAESVEPTSPAESHGEDDSGRPLTSNEDKRRRNTQASARFRLKKKEREMAMETKCKELEGKVGELERECEALRRENGWLKGLVVGVTGGTGMPMTMPTGPGIPAGPAASSSSSTSTSSGKRKRDSTSDSS